MPMAASDIEKLIRDALPDAVIEIRDLAGDGDHYAARVVSKRFEGLTAFASTNLSTRRLGDDGRRATRTAA